MEPQKEESEKEAIALQELKELLSDEQKAYRFLVNERLRESFDGAAFGWQTVRQDSQKKFLNAFDCVMYDFENVCSILKKIDWMLECVDKDILYRHECESFIQTDLHALHVELRSLFDSLASAIEALYPKPKQLPESFNDLLNTLADEKSYKRISSGLGIELCDLILDCGWFTELRDHRDNIVHKRRDASVRIVDSKAKDVRFSLQFRSEDEEYSGPPEFVTADKRILLRPHAGYFVGRTLNALNRFADIVQKKLDIPIKVSIPYHQPGIEELESCVQAAVSRLTEGAIVEPDEEAYGDD